jgi:CBS domain containing-hemolysin-like protein
MSLILVLFMILLSAFFSGVEIAYFSANRLKIELRSQQGEFIPKILSRFLHKNNHFITTLLIGNNVALVIYGITLSKMLETQLSQILPTDSTGMLMLVTQTLISTGIILVFGEFLPKALFRRDPDRLLEVTAIPMWIFEIILYPFSKAISGLSYLLIKYVLRVNTEKETLVFGRTDLDYFIRQILPGESSANTEYNPEIDTEAFNKALEFNKVRVK